MNHGQYVFSQIVTFLPARSFDRCVNRFKGDKWVKYFTCWNQLLCMMFGQISARDSLRDLLICLNAHKSKHYHLGFGRNISRSNLSEANEKRDARIFEMFANILIGEAQKILKKRANSEISVPGNIYAFDSTTIDLCLNVFWWATFKQSKAAVKLHVLFDVKTLIPVFLDISTALVHDVNGLDWIKYENGGFYVLDRAYIDFRRLNKIDQHSAFFITRAKANFTFAKVTSKKPDKINGVYSDQIVALTGIKQKKVYTKHLRRIKYYDQEQSRIFIFLSNNMELPAKEIALLYKHRWKIELFFKWIKSHLQVKTFWGTTANAVRIQLYSAIISYVTVLIIKEKMKLNQSPYEILQIISVSLLDKTPLDQLFKNGFCQDSEEKNDIQLKINLI